MDLTSLLSSPIGQGVIQTVSSQLGMNQKQASSAVNVAVPAILAGLTKNARTRQGAESLNKALEAKHDGSLLENIAELFQSQTGALQQDGNSILEHIFGSNRAAVEKGVAQQSGLTLEKVKPLLAILAPIVMAYVGKQKRQSKTASGGLGDLLGELLSAGAPSKKGGGSLLSTIGGLLGGGTKKNNGGLIDDILGGLLK
ncbi:hypothetical protein MASR2M12_12990 [Bacteroidales bacterium]